jgi:hypothetical protein
MTGYAASHNFVNNFTRFTITGEMAIYYKL